MLGLKETKRDRRKKTVATTGWIVKQAFMSSLGIQTLSGALGNYFRFVVSCHKFDKKHHYCSIECGKSKQIRELERLVRRLLQYSGELCWLPELQYSVVVEVGQSGQSENYLGSRSDLVTLWVELCSSVSCLDL